MNDHSAAIDIPIQRQYGQRRLSAVWRFRLALALVCVGAGLLSILLGPDNYWDLRYYHLYNPWAYLHHRYLYDIGPAQEQGFLNPTADFLLYGLITSPLNDFPRVVAFIMGAVHGINAALLLAIVCQVICPPQALDRFALRAVAWAFGVSGSGFVSLLGTSTNDLTSSLFVLGALLSLLKVAEGAGGGRASWKGFAAGGLWAGLGLGLKYTVAFVVPGLGVVALLVAFRKRTLIGLILFGLAAGLGVLIFAGHHMLVLWEDFGNPLFPYMNQIFRSPYFEPTEIWDPRFIPDSFFKLMTFPFYWTRLNDYVVSEPKFRDWRGAIAYVAIVFGALALIAAWLRARRLPAGLAQTPGLGLVLSFLIVSYFSWALQFGYYRYAIPLEMLTGVVTVGMLIWVFEDRRLRLVAGVAVLVLAASTTVYLDWGRRPYTEKYIEVEVPPLPPDSIVLIATWDPAAYFIPYAEPSARYLGIENNYLQISQSNKLAVEVKRLMRTPGPPKYVVSVGKFDAGKLNSLLANFGLRLAAAPCAPVHSNIEDQALSLCRVD